ncbi:MAG: hypothetical protein AB1545_14070 [Thermodesulfobacteriota bacterium]|jgi:hypothetical protein
MKIQIILIWITLFFLTACTGTLTSEIISQQEAIRIATKVANQNGYNTDNKDIEILKVAEGVERGPVRMSWVIARLSSKDEVNKILNSKFWIIYFYPQKAFEGSGILGGGFCSLIDMTTGEVIQHFNDM